MSEAPRVVSSEAVATPVMFRAISPAAGGGLGDVAAHLVRRRGLLLDGARDRRLEVVDLIDDRADLAIASTASWVSLWIASIRGRCPRSPSPSPSRAP
jgi:hypothetical protein